jgi:hypothetical protein
MKTRTHEMPTVVDVYEIHMPEYEPTTTNIEKEQNPAHEVEQLKEDVERTKSDASKGTRIQQEEHATYLTQ